MTWSPPPGPPGYPQGPPSYPQGPPPGQWQQPPAPYPQYGQPYSQQYGQQYIVYAGFWSRVGSRVLDSLIGVAVMLPFIAGAIGLFVLAFQDCDIVDVGDTDEIICNGNQKPGFIAPAIVLLLGGIALWIVLVIRWWAKGQTPGMRAVSNRLVRMGTLQPIGMGRATGRFFASYLSSWLCYLGYFWMLWDKNKQTWHDMMCDTIVIKT
jgi:uncharacterized RDD family membrane protein YckC